MDEEQHINWKIYSLITVFTISSWIDINGLWVELPYLVQLLPESWDLSSYLVIIMQIANIGPICYILVLKCLGERVKKWIVIYFIIIIGIISTILLSSFWNKTVVVNGKKRSLYLFIFSCLLALVDCTSSVVYLPYMNNFNSRYTSAYYFGQGLSGFIPSVAGLIQGIGSEPECVNKTIFSNNSSTSNSSVPEYKEPNFSVSSFMLLLCGVLCVSLTAFTILHFCYRKRFSLEKNLEKSQEATLSKQITLIQVTFLLIFMALSNALSNGIIPSIQPYSCLPYGNLAYNLTIRIGMIVNPLVCFLSSFKHLTNFLYITLITILGVLCSVYLVVIAVLSPNVPFRHHWLGVFFIILSTIILVASLSFIKVCIARVLMLTNSRYLLWCGIVSQIGSFLGALCSFLLVNYSGIFQSSSPC